MYNLLTFILIVFPFYIEIIRNERDLVKAMRKLSSTSNNGDFLRGLSTLMHSKSSPKAKNVNELIAITKHLYNPIELQAQKLLAKRQEMLKLPKMNNPADVLDRNAPQNTAFRKEVVGLIEKLNQATSQVRKNVQKRRANAVHSQLKKKRAGLDTRSDEQAISIYDAFQSCLERLARIPNVICLEILGSARCGQEQATTSFEELTTTEDWYAYATSTVAPSTVSDVEETAAYYSYEDK